MNEIARLSIVRYMLRRRSSPS